MYFEIRINFLASAPNYAGCMPMTVLESHKPIGHASDDRVLCVLHPAAFSMSSPTPEMLLSRSVRFRAAASDIPVHWTTARPPLRVFRGQSL